MNSTPSHATIRIGKTVFEDLPVLYIDYNHKLVTVEFYGLGEILPFTTNLSNIIEFTFPTCVNEIA